MESETRSGHHKKKVKKKNLRAVYCYGRKAGYLVRKKQAIEDKQHVMQLLQGVSMGVGALQCVHENKALMEGDQQLELHEIKV